jgi:hypothetical protein
MATNGNAEPTFVEDIIRLASRAVLLHAAMTGDQDAEETFIRDQVAIGLYKERRVKVSMEVTPMEFLRIAEEDKMDAFTLASKGPEFRRFEIDLIAWHPTWPDPAYPFAIIEVKKGQGFLDDIQRTSRLLAFCHPHTLGYQVECLICPKASITAREQTLKRRIQELKSICGEPVIGTPWQLPETDPKAEVYCMAAVIPVLRAIS